MIFECYKMCGFDVTLMLSMHLRVGTFLDTFGTSETVTKMVHTPKVISFGLMHRMEVFQLSREGEEFGIRTQKNSLDIQMCEGRLH